MTSLKTPFSQLLNIELLIVQAPIGSATCPALAAAVTEAGGLGMLALSWRDLDEIREIIRETRERTSRSVDGGAYVIAAQCWKAGGHVRGQVASFPLIPKWWRR